MARIVMPLADEFEDTEFQVPFDRLRQADYQVTIVGRRAGQRVMGKNVKASTTVDAAAHDLHPEDFDALVIPGGHAPDTLRMDEDLVEFVRRFGESGRPIAAICHGPQLLIEADLVRGRTLTSWPSIRKDLENAGAHWVDREVVEDGELITSRKPQDAEAFSRALLRALERKPAARR